MHAQVSNEIFQSTDCDEIYALGIDPDAGYMEVSRGLDVQKQNPASRVKMTLNRETSLHFQ
ncbi:uncharacterized protein N7503_008867 [Penicillium pulvis]|uniref:uncharacterized protein n=1 Tax=Penicillium pulvis TaxID=1562058 RepID=UPI0025470D15|nr:uncharacterized protein N7503_008867 [Penicillium pulvis]KAJ5792889.1 hypothetical protein N7503_008867 [Penicillium pulvis]